MSVTQKDYDYDAVVAFTNTGGPLDQALSKLQEDLVKLRQKINDNYIELSKSRYSLYDTNKNSLSNNVKYIDRIFYIKWYDISHFTFY